MIHNLWNYENWYIVLPLLPVAMGEQSSFVEPVSFMSLNDWHSVSLLQSHLDIKIGIIDFQ